MTKRMSYHQEEFAYGGSVEEQIFERSSEFQQECRQDTQSKSMFQPVKVSHDDVIVFSSHKMVSRT